MTSSANRSLAAAMRVFSVILLTALLAVCVTLPQGQAQAQALQAVKALSPATPASPSKPVASTIIPGSPLAALTGAAPPPAPDENTPTPFGTESLGLMGLNKVAGEAGDTVNEFAKAIQDSTRLTPVLQWLQSFGTDKNQRRHLADAAIGLLLTMLPALAVEAAVTFLLRRPRAAVIQVALARRAQDAPPEPDGITKAEQGETEPNRPRRLTFLTWARRLGLALSYILLALLPLLAFFLTLAVLLYAGVITTKTTHLIAVGAANAYLLVRVIAELLRFIYQPEHASLRLIHTTDERALWITRTITRIAATIAFGYIVVSIAEILGLSLTGGLVLTRLIALAVHIQLAVFVWQSRHIVAGWIRGKPDESSLMHGVRQRIAAGWHYFALFYILALWVAYTGGIQNAFGVLLRFVAVFIGALVLGRLCWVGVAQLLERVLSDDPEGAKKHPDFSARARVYHPLISGVLRLFIGVAVVLVMLQGWGYHILPWLMKDKLSRALVSVFIAILITVALALLAWELANAVLNRRVERLSNNGRARQAQRLKTLLPILRAAIGISIGLAAGLICLSKIGVNAAPLLAGAGVLGIAIGFGSQKLVQDIITGLFLLLEDAMQVGDVITLAGMSGTVERLSVRTIRLRGGDGSVNIIPFSAVTTVTNQTRDFGYAQISINVGYEENLTHVYAVLTDIAKNMRAEPAWGAMIRDDLQLNGLDEFGASALVITGQIRTGPGQHWAVRREFYARVKKRFEQDKIEIPYTYLPPAPPPPAPPVTPPAAAPIAGSHPPAHGAAPDGV